MSRLHWGARVSVGLVVALFLAGTLATVSAQIPLTAVSACVHRVSGIVRILPAGTPCQPNESPVQWSIVGPQGPKGDKGDKGDQGLPGPKGDPGLQGPSDGSGVAKGITTAVYGSVNKDGGWVDPSQETDWWSDYQYMYSDSWLYVVELLTFTDSTKTPACVVSPRPSYNGSYYDWRHQQVAVVSVAWSYSYKHWRFSVFSSELSGDGDWVPLKQAFDFICVQK